MALDLPNDDVRAAWLHSGLAVVPSRTDGFGQAAAEAMACGRAVVASAVGGLTDVVRHGETGLLVSPGDVDGLRSAISALLADNALRTRMGAAGRERARLFAASAVTDRVDKMLSGDDRISMSDLPAVRGLPPGARSGTVFSQGDGDLLRSCSRGSADARSATGGSTRYAFYRPHLPVDGLAARLRAWCAGGCLRLMAPSTARPPGRRGRAYSPQWLGLLADGARSALSRPVAPP